MKKQIKNPWMKHLDKVRKEHPKLTLSEAMKTASKTYKKK